MSRAVAAFVLLLAACGRPCPPPAPARVAAIGETFRITSQVLGEERVVNVYLPPGYAEGAERYPVLYMPDGGMNEDFPHIAGHVDVSIKNQVIRPILVVGVQNTERRRDLVGPTSVAEERDIAPQAGGADRFRRFLADELKPYVAARFRVSGESALIGESFAGLFVIETLLVEPALFDAYIAADPSVWWNRGALVASAGERFARWREPPKQLFIATADTPEMQDGVAALVAAIREHAPAGLVAHHVPMPEERHHTIFPFAALRGIRTVFAAPPAAP
ncbi:MAG: alpha/beta hydrolase [Deltaproteobacteria bacterium]|nr:alpha/beta hydrolase [Kofleriaceae bacterium]